MTFPDPDDRPQPRYIPGRLAWGLLIVGCAVIMVLWLAVTGFRSAIGDGPMRPGALTAADAAEAMEDRSVTVPGQFEFVTMTAVPVPGRQTPTLVGRYEADGADFQTSSRQIEQENVRFPVWRTASCEDPAVTRNNWAPTGFSCLPGDPLLVTTRLPDGGPVTGDSGAMPAGSQTLMLTERDGVVQFYVSLNGF